MPELRQEVLGAISSPAQQGEDGWVRGRFRFLPGFKGFEGHFPGNPILPAVVQMLAAQVLIEQSVARPLVLRRVVNAKFRQQIRPEEEVCVAFRLRPKTGAHSYETTLEVGAERAASFTLLFEGEGAS